MALFGSAFVFGKLVLNTNVPPLLFGSLRMLVVVICLLPFFNFKIPKENLKSLFIFSFSMGVGVTGFTYLSLRNASNNGYIEIGNVTQANLGLMPVAGGTFTGKVTHNYTNSLNLPVGTTAQRDGSPAVGMLRYNSTENQFEGYKNTGWGEIGGGAGATGGGTDEVFVETDQNVTTNYTLTANKHAHTVSPTINSGVTITVPSGAILVIL